MVNQKYYIDSSWSGKRFQRIIWSIIIGSAVLLFFPWTQNIQSDGVVTTLRPNERPQSVQPVIAGQIIKWYVKDGDLVKEGDTICVIGEVKSEYLDPGLIGQTNAQIQAKENSVLSYSSKIEAINNQITQLEANRDFSIQKAQVKYEQEQFKYQSELAELKAAEVNSKIAQQQFVRDSLLSIKQIKSPLDVENRRVKYQEAFAKLQMHRAKLDIAKNAIENARLELQNIKVEYGEKLAKTESDRYTAISAQMETESEIAKLRNQYSNYLIRNGFYVIRAPQDGLISQTLSNGVGITVKEGQSICMIVPSEVNLAVELYIKPVDMPLIEIGSPVQVIFDGWPTMVFSGWPELSYGAFPGRIYAVDNVLNEKGYYRVLVKADEGKKPWPKELKIGVGSMSFMLLKRVPVWYELWRQLNGFPADYYHNDRKDPSKNDHSK